MTVPSPQSFLQPGQPSRTSILVAAARAFGSRDPDESVRNPDFLADRLLGPEELGLIRWHPISQGLQQDYAEASQVPEIAMLTTMMIARTRFIDEALERAVNNGATQIVILGAGFDSRAYRFQELLKDCQVLEVDAAPTQEYKKRRVRASLIEVPKNLTYVTVDFANDNIIEALKAGGFREGAQTFYIWEGVSMYLREENVRNMLQMVASHSGPGSSIVLDYANRLGVEWIPRSQPGPAGIPPTWSEPWLFGVPDVNGADFFRQFGFDPGVPISTSNPELYQRYARRQDGTTYAASLFARMRAEAQARIEAGQEPAHPAFSPEMQKAAAASGGLYWFAELTIASGTEPSP